MAYHLSRGGQYAIRAMLHLASLGTGETARQADIAHSTNIPLPYLSKILASLARSGLVSARRGPWGGVRLRVAPEALIIRDILLAIEGTDNDHDCILGYAKCNLESPCPLHVAWVPIRDRIESEIHSKSLADLMIGSPVPV
jgi:Rrf2 family protein